MKNIFENKSVENLINGTMQNLHTLVEANTIIGDPVISPDGTIIIPISKVSVGYVVGGGEFLDLAKKKKIENYPLAGGSGGGVTITPMGFLINSEGDVRYIDTENKSAFDSVLNLLSKLAEKLEGDKKWKSDTAYLCYV